MTDEQNSIEKVIHECSRRRVLTGNFTSSTSKETIYYKRSEPLDDCGDCIHLIILHDLGDYHARYLLLADLLEERLDNKVKFTWIDFKGHGMSTGTRGHLADFTEYCLDVVTGVNIAMKKSKEGDRFFFLGSGVGATTALKTYHLHYHRLIKEIHGIIALNPALKFQLPLPHWAEVLVQDIKLGENVSKFRIPYHLDGRDFSDDETLADEYNRDPLILHKLTFGFYQQILKAAMAVRAASYFIDIPCLIIVGERDNFCDPNITKLFYKGMPKKSTKLVVCPDEKHDLLNGKGRDKIYAEIENWLQEQK